MNPAKDGTLAVVGLGLLGASLAEAVRKRFPDWRIVGISSAGTIREALDLRLVDEGFEYSGARSALSRCDWVFLCTPIDHILELLGDWSRDPPAFKPGAVISDVGSTKAAICGLGKKAVPARSGAAFIGSHPMAGSEKTGLRSRDPHLFENAAWVLCPDVDAPEEAVRKLEDFAQELGARCLRMAPRTHDAVIARVSHLPQLLSTALAAFVAREKAAEECLQVAGAGFRDMTRLAASSFEVWDPILRTNRKNILDLLPRFRAELEGLESALRGDGPKKAFAEAAELRTKVAASRKGFSSPLTEILVDIEDKPGALLAILAPLTQTGINVLDIEILKVREGEEGVLMMGFRKPGEALAALRLLAETGHKGRLR